MSAADSITLETRQLPSRDESAKIKLPPPEALPLPPVQMPSRRDAYLAEDRGRIAIWAKVMSVIAVASLLLPFVAGGHAVSRTILLLSIASALTANLIAYYTATRASRYRRTLVGVCALVQGWSACGIGYYWGIFSPFSAMIALGICVYAMSGARFPVLSYVNVAAGFGIMSILIAIGVIPDHGLVQPLPLTLGQRLVVICALQASFALSFSLGHKIRKNTVRVIEEFENSVRELSERQALIKEARLEIDRAAGTRTTRGRFTDQILGSFQLGALLGRGASGEVYDAVHLVTGAPCAVKLLRRAVLSDLEAITRFAHESRIAAKVDAENVVRVLEVAGLDSPLPYIAMERVVGPTLAYELRIKQKLALPEVVELIDQLARGLETARGAGIVHRDLKPHNVVCSRRSDGQRLWKILDFGVSVISSEHDGEADGLVMGTPQYMAPEQALGQSVDHRADVYSLGVIAYRCLTGAPPFPGHDPRRVLEAVIHSTPAEPSRLTSLPREIDAVLAIAMAKKPDERFDTATEFAHALARASRGGLLSRHRRRAQTLAGRASAA